VNGLLALSSYELAALANALAGGRLTLPASRFAVDRVLGRTAPEAVHDALAKLGSEGLAGALRLAAAAGSSQAREPELVWTGPDETQALRSTSTVVEELFRRAERSVLLSGFALTHGEKVFQILAGRLDVESTLEVRLFLNVHRREGVAPEETVTSFAREFRERLWPGKRSPKVYYDPRSVLADRHQRAVLHAKCVVVDHRRALVTSANFTPHAQQRNIELGVALENPGLAGQIEDQFSRLLQAGHLVPLPTW
jgi:phosphatidylserine/phosphatidylglycerophosphate/cardiolipin synthase-like enzyme